MTQSPELKPCPFCGGPATIGYFAMTPNIDCPECKYSIDGDQEENPGEAVQLNHLIACWNRRADLPPTPAEALRCPEVAAAITAMRDLIVAHASGWIDGADGGAGQKARATIAALEHGARK